MRRNDYDYAIRPLYVCRNCGETFDEPKEYVERHCPPGLIYTETYVGCPSCGSGYDELDNDEWSELCGVSVDDDW